MSTNELANALKSYLIGDYPDIDVWIFERDSEHDRRRVFFRSEKFGVLYPLQRYHYIAHHIPREFYDEHLANTEWYELAPGETEADLRYPDNELITSITPDVMNCLQRSGFLHRLDERMCPEDPSRLSEQCHGDFRIARSTLAQSGFTEDEYFDVLHVLMAQGGYCDCEILYNAAPESHHRFEANPMPTPTPLPASWSLMSCSFDRRARVSPLKAWADPTQKQERAAPKRLKIGRAHV